MQRSHQSESDGHNPPRNNTDGKKRLQLTLYLRLLQSKGFRVTCAQTPPVLGVSSWSELSFFLQISSSLNGKSVSNLEQADSGS